MKLEGCYIMRKQISVTHPRVIEIFAQQKNVSRYIQDAVLAYDGYRENNYVTREELMQILNGVTIKRQSVSREDVKCILDL